MEEISWQDFLKVEIRVGKVLTAQKFPEARKPAYLLHIDFGAEVGIRKTSAQITDLYLPEDLEGKLVVGVINLGFKQIGPIQSECLVTGFHRDDGSVVLCVPDGTVQPGARLL